MTELAHFRGSLYSAFSTGSPGMRAAQRTADTFRAGSTFEGPTSLCSAKRSLAEASGFGLPASLVPNRFAKIPKP